MTHDGLVRTSEIAVTVVLLVLTVLLLGSLRQTPRGPRWVVVLACLLLYAAVVGPPRRNARRCAGSSSGRC